MALKKRPFVSFAISFLTLIMVQDYAGGQADFNQNAAYRSLISSNLPASTAITHAEYDYCIASLEDVAKDGNIGEAEFMLFLERYFDNPLHFDAFHEIPLQLVLVFYTAACTGGRNCHKEPPMISLDHLASTEAFLRVFCNSVKNVTVSQLVFSFQYQVQPDQSDTIALSTHTWSSLELTSRLNFATRHIILDTLLCVEADRNSRGRVLRGTANRRLSWMDQPKCDYSVQIPATQMQGTKCLPSTRKVREGGPCYLVTSTVKVTEAALSLEATNEELRAMLLEALKGAIYDGSFDQLLRLGQR
eukprot:CAMPEP_0176015422 /NCGR_PEP_ID=MMETSP0120_2-20121206/7331_1 /TAXON_ID=160619 /ORGANISM="Kryptoperidinium foliaceum, Strain CCMP 1326" /LENGTH=302 /DNA_ID=CAMNT_0017348395 /DNA_START=473 /DNA_END=1381 /DNA_ORIENTATION=+